MPKRRRTTRVESTGGTVQPKPHDRKQGDPPVLEGALGKESVHLAVGSQSVRGSEGAGNDRGIIQSSIVCIPPTFFDLRGRATV